MHMQLPLKEHTFNTALFPGGRQWPSSCVFSQSDILTKNYSSLSIAKVLYADPALRYANAKFLCISYFGRDCRYVCMCCPRVHNNLLSTARRRIMAGYIQNSFLKALVGA